MLIGLVLKRRLAPLNQTAIAPGYFKKQWKDGRNYFITKWIKNVESTLIIRLNTK
jgi:hypothetical protein